MNLPPIIYNNGQYDIIDPIEYNRLINLEKTTINTITNSSIRRRAMIHDRKNLDNIIYMIEKNIKERFNGLYDIIPFKILLYIAYQFDNDTNIMIQQDLIDEEMFDRLDKYFNIIETKLTITQRHFMIDTSLEEKIKNQLRNENITMLNIKNEYQDIDIDSLKNRRYFQILIGDITPYITNIIVEDENHVLVSMVIPFYLIELNHLKIV